MAAPLGKFDGSAVQALHGSRSAAAVAAAAGSVHLHQRDGL
ncbi:MAG TPA: hypothetical protein VGF27_16050 [Pseudoduganella sp.]